MGNRYLEKIAEEAASENHNRSTLAKAGLIAGGAVLGATAGAGAAAAGLAAIKKIRKPLGYTAAKKEYFNKVLGVQDALADRSEALEAAKAAKKYMAHDGGLKDLYTRIVGVHKNNAKLSGNTARENARRAIWADRNALIEDAFTAGALGGAAGGAYYGRNKQASEGATYSMPLKDAISEHKKLTQVLRSNNRKDELAELKDQGAELKEMLHNANRRHSAG